MMEVHSGGAGNLGFEPDLMNRFTKPVKEPIAVARPSG